MKKNQNGFATIAVALIVAATLLVGAGVYFYQTQIGKPTSPAVPAVQETGPQTASDQIETVNVSNWEIYRWNGFEFQYPANWIVEKTYYQSAASPTQGNASENIGLKIFPDISKKEIDFIGIGGHQISCDSSENHSKCQFNSLISDFIYTDSGSEEILKMFEPIIATIKLEENKSVNTSDWKTYRNEEWGFEFKYPDGYYHLEEIDNGIRFSTDDLMDCQNLVSEKEKMFCSQVEGGISPLVYFSSAEERLQGMSFADYLNGQAVAGGDMKKIEGNNIWGVEIEENGMAGKYKSIYFLRGDRLINFSVAGGSNDKGGFFLDQIVATFKFIEPDIRYDMVSAPEQTESAAQNQSEIEAPPSGKNDSAERQETAIVPKKFSRVFSSEAIFDIAWDAGQRAEIQGCSDGGADCQAAALKKLGAGEGAIEFWRQSDWGLMANYIGYGDYQSGYYAVLDVLNPLAANSNHQFALYDAGENIWYLMATDFSKIGDSGRLAKEFPAGREISFSNGEWIGLNKNSELVFTFDITTGCRACGTGYRAVIGYKIDLQNSQVYADLLGFCAEDAVADSKYSACSDKNRILSL